MNLFESATILHYHRHRMATYGDAAVQALGWKCVDSQRKRFDVIADAANFDGSAILDIGCGHGDLKPFLDERFVDFSYIGIDHLPEFIAQAEARYGTCPRTWFHTCDFSKLELPHVDYVIASGALGYRCAQPQFHLEMVGRMYQAAERALIFNALDAAFFPEHPLLVGRNYEQLVAYCRGLCPNVNVVRGYLYDDFTICVVRAQVPAPLNRANAMTR
jgi:SAM-dependent methyltransferase